MNCKAFNKQILIGKKLKPCCVYEGGVSLPEKDNIIDTYKNIYKNKSNEFSKECIQCIQKEKMNLTSKRLFYDKLFINDKYKDEITYFDIRFSNVCNLKCRMCEGASSSRWIEDEIFLEKNNFNRINKSTNIYITPKKIITEIINYCVTLKSDNIYFEIKGGEPFISKEFLEFLEVIPNYIKQKIHIKITTNGISITQKYLDKLKGFKNITIIFSVESINNKIYKYIRGDKYNVYDLLKGIKLVQSYNFKLEVSIVITIYNIFTLEELLKWLYKIKVIKKDFKFTNFIHNPNYLDSGILPKNIKQELIQKYKKYKELKFVVIYLEKSKYNKAKLKEFFTFNILLDTFRNELNPIKELNKIKDDYAS